MGLAALPWYPQPGIAQGSFCPMGVGHPSHPPRLGMRRGKAGICLLSIPYPLPGIPLLPSQLDGDDGAVVVGVSLDPACSPVTAWQSLGWTGKGHMDAAGPQHAMMPAHWGGH